MAKLFKLDDIKISIQRVIDSYDNNGIIGPISYLEEAINNIESAIEEEEIYKEIDCHE